MWCAAATKSRTPAARNRQVTGPSDARGRFVNCSKMSFIAAFPFPHHVTGGRLVKPLLHLYHVYHTHHHIYDPLHLPANRAEPLFPPERTLSCSSTASRARRDPGNAQAPRATRHPPVPYHRWLQGRDFNQPLSSTPQTPQTGTTARPSTSHSLPRRN